MSDKERNFTCDLHCKRAVTPTCVQAEAHVPIHLKMTLTIKEAAEYSSIGINKIDALLKPTELLVCALCRDAETRKAA